MSVRRLHGASPAFLFRDHVGAWIKAADLCPPISGEALMFYLMVLLGLAAAAAHYAATKEAN